MIQWVRINRKSNVTQWRQTTSLGETEYQLVFRWNARVGRWFLTLEDLDGTVLLGGRKLVADTPLIQRHLVTAGELWALDTTGQGLDPELSDLGTRVRLVYSYESS